MIYDKITRILFFGFIFTAIIESYLPTSVAVFNSLEYVSFNIPINALPSMITILYFALVIVFPFFILIFLTINSNRLRNKEFKHRYGSLYLDINTSKRGATLFFVLFTLRRLIFAIIVTSTDYQYRSV